MKALGPGVRPELNPIVKALGPGVRPELNLTVKEAKPSAELSCYSVESD